MIVDNPLPPARASVSPGRVFSPADETGFLRREGTATAKPLFMGAESYRVDAVRDARWLTLGRQKAAGRIVV